MFEEKKIGKGQNNSVQSILAPSSRRSSRPRAWCNTGVAGKWNPRECSSCHCTCAARGLDAWRRIVARTGKTRPGQRPSECRRMEVGDRKSQALEAPKLCGQKAGWANGTLASEHRRRKCILEESVEDSHRKVDSTSPGPRAEVSQRRPWSKLGCGGRESKGSAIRAISDHSDQQSTTQNSCHSVVDTIKVRD